MSQKEIQLYDDSVIKLTIKQGNESERFPATLDKNGSFNYNGETYNFCNFKDISTIPGSFSSGELAYTRDTNRLFIGNISEQLKNSQQQTLGGILSGNKYLGFIDSRQTNYSSSDPISLTSLLEDSQYRTHNFEDETSKKAIATKDNKWARETYYNPKYDAYDGDYMYDIYRNAFILFDHNITTTNGPTYNTTTIAGKRKTPLIERFADKSDDLKAEEKVLKNFTGDMYGDGYVLIYNVIPDGDTLSFTTKSFDSTGKSVPGSSDIAENYSYNIIKLNRVPANTLYDALDPGCFILDKDGDKNVISLKTAKKGIEAAGDFDTTESKILVNAVDSGEIKIMQTTYSTEDLQNLSKVNELFDSLGSSSLAEFIQQEVDEKFNNSDALEDAVYKVFEENDITSSISDLANRVSTSETKVNDLESDIRNFKTTIFKMPNYGGFYDLLGNSENNEVEEDEENNEVEEIIPEITIDETKSTIEIDGTGEYTKGDYWLYLEAPADYHIEITLDKILESSNNSNVSTTNEGDTSSEEEEEDDILSEAVWIKMGTNNLLPFSGNKYLKVRCVDEPATSSSEPSTAGFKTAYWFPALNIETEDSSESEGT